MRFVQKQPRRHVDAAVVATARAWPKHASFRRARRFEHEDFGGKMSPLRSIELFPQTETTSPWWVLTGLSMLTLLLEDSTGELLCHHRPGTRN
jgi:hypothetical protein